MSPRLDGARKASLSHWLALTLFILQKSRMRRRARTDLCGGRSAMGVPTATISPALGRSPKGSIAEYPETPTFVFKTTPGDGGKCRRGFGLRDSN